MEQIQRQARVAPENGSGRCSRIDDLDVTRCQTYPALEAQRVSSESVEKQLTQQTERAGTIESGRRM